MSFKAGDKVKCINIEDAEGELTLGNIYTIKWVNERRDLCEIKETLKAALWLTDRFELIEKDSGMNKPKEFTPKPGDKIICNNGEEFTCCGLKYLRLVISDNFYCDDPIIGFVHDVNGWCSWKFDGKYGGISPEWDIREVIPKQEQEKLPEETEVQSGHNVVASFKPELTYTTENIRKAVIDDLGWQDLSLDLIIKSLQRVTSKEYNEYLRLKAMFETEEE